MHVLQKSTNLMKKKKTQKKSTAEQFYLVVV